jgi:hypothetical protein
LKKLLLLITLALLVFVVVYRQRLFLRDPLATVKRDGIKQGDVQVMINYSNDILMDDASGPKRRLYVVQNWNKAAEFSTGPLKCVTYAACMTDADQATGERVLPGARGRRDAFEGVTMTNKRVEFVDEDGALVEVDLR